MSKHKEFTHENYSKAIGLKLENKYYFKEKDLETRIHMFEMYTFAVKWIAKYRKYRRSLINPTK